jgi:hypothetical protein
VLGRADNDVTLGWRCCDDLLVMLLVPADVLHPRRVDEHFAAEAAAARAAGYQVATIDHDELARGGDPRRVVRHVTGGGPAVYRGWMVRSEQYAALAEALAEREVYLSTNAGQYRRGHELPGWYPALAGLTPTSVWTAGTDRDAFEVARTRLGAGPAVLRDYTKSMKHYWHEAAFIPDLTDARAAWAVADRFAQLRGEDLVGGFVLRRYERFNGPEVRTWWINGVCGLVSAHPDTAQDRPPVDVNLDRVQAVVAGLDLSFVAVDLVHRDDGAWRVVEVGDGQVSDRPATTPAEQLITMLLGRRIDTSPHDDSLVEVLPQPSAIANWIAAAWRRVSGDCGCADIYYCPASDAIECPRHGGFDTCCNRVAAHLPVR